MTNCVENTKNGFLENVSIILAVVGNVCKPLISFTSIISARHEWILQLS